ncbi:MAG: histidine kinase [Bacteroidota bacterium]
MKFLLERRFWIHFMFWGVLFTLLLVLNRNRFGEVDALLITAITIAILSSFFYTNYLWISGFYLSRRYIAYYTMIALFLGAGVGLFYVTQIAIPSNFERRIQDERRRDESAQLSPEELEQEDPSRTETRQRGRRPRIQRSVFYVVPIALLMLVTWALSSFLRTADEARKREHEVDLLRAEQFDTELKLLKSQINPHFLFNALNNIYSLTVTKSEKAPDMLLKLSSMLRYVLYEGSEDKVSLASEIKYIQDYIDLQRLKDEEIENIEFTHTEETDYWIHPMLLIPFVENAFKHSKVEDLVHGWLTIDLQIVQGSYLAFSVKNSLPDQVVTDETGGIGIENVRRRLELMYPSAYELEISKHDDSFQVRLQLPFK